MKPRPLLTSRNRELVPKEHQFHVLGELGPTTADEQPQDCGKSKVGEGEEHRAILPGPANWFGVDRPLRRSEGFGYPRARVNPEETWQGAEPRRTFATAERLPAPRTRHSPAPRINLQSEF